jgi:hypothetical protein
MQHAMRILYPCSKANVKRGEIGFVYVMSNSICPKWLKIGMTIRTPEIRLQEANFSKMNTWILPAPYANHKAAYKLDFAKKVTYPLGKEKTLHLLLHDKRVNVNKEFFEISLDELMPYFALMDGEEWEEDANDTDDTDEIYTPNVKDIIDPNDPTVIKDMIACRDTRKCFTHGQPIRSTIGNDIWIGIYDWGTNTIECNGITYGGRAPLQNFVNAHMKVYNKIPTNAWKHCDCLKKGQWVSTDTLEECEDYWTEEEPM